MTSNPAPVVFYKSKVTTAVTLEETGETPLPVKPGFDFSIDHYFDVTEAGSTDVDLPANKKCGGSGEKELSLANDLGKEEGDFLQISINPFDEEAAKKSGLEFWFKNDCNQHWNLKKDQIVFAGNKIKGPILCVQNHYEAPITVTARWIKSMDTGLLPEGLEEVTISNSANSQAQQSKAGAN